MIRKTNQKKKKKPPSNSITLIVSFFVHLCLAHLSIVWRLSFFPNGFTIRDCFQDLHHSSYSSSVTSIYSFGLKGTLKTSSWSITSSSKRYSSVTISTISSEFSLSKSSFNNLPL
ncbi:uncharacterized protein DS421_14g451140 [Arachis hypogaea]|nr:uncharacterized protein DS421_14g451140 [Arachis hypogaea]